MSLINEYIEIIKAVKYKNWIREHLTNKNSTKFCINGHLAKYSGLNNYEMREIDQDLEPLITLLGLDSDTVIALANINDDYDIGLPHVRKLAIEVLNNTKKGIKSEYNLDTKEIEEINY